MKFDSKHQAFFALVKAGLWEKDVLLSTFNKIEYQEINRLAEEQAVVGLVAAGLEHVTDVIVPKEDLLQFAGQVLQLEQRNKAMNEFLACWLRKLHAVEVSPVIIKGQGIAQCYERPLWRSSGDVDLLIDSQTYDFAKNLLIPYSKTEPKETVSTKEFCLTIEGWAVELHGSLYCRLTKRLDKFLKKIQDDCCKHGKVRVWNVAGTDLLLPSINNDVFVIFTHIVKHFFREGVGLRQLCDWCRLMWTYRDDIDKKLLEHRLEEAGIMSEWKAFASLVVEWLGMPIEAMPFYSASWRWRRKSKKIMSFVLETGNFGQNRDYSYSDKYPRLIVKAISLCRHTWDLSRQFFIFPLDSIRVWKSMVNIGVNQWRNEKRGL